MSVCPIKGIKKELNVYVGQNLENLGQTAMFMQRGRAFVIGNCLQMA